MNFNSMAGMSGYGNYANNSGYNNYSNYGAANNYSGYGGYGNFGNTGFSLNSTPNWQMMNNNYMSADQKLAFIDAKYGHLFNAGLMLNPSNVMPHLWNAQKLAVENYMDFKMQQMQASQGQQGGGNMITQLLGSLMGSGGGGLMAMLPQLLGK